MPSRRSTLIGLGSIFAGTTGVISAGAFNIARAERDVTVSMEGDANAYLKLDPQGEYTSYDDDNDLAINFAGGNGQNGDGLNTNTKFQFNDVFWITNQGTDTIQLTLATGDGDGDPDTEDDLNNPIIWSTEDAMGDSSSYLPNTYISDEDGDYGNGYNHNDQVDDGDWNLDSTCELEPGEALSVHFCFDGLGKIVGSPDDASQFKTLTIYAET